jgi:putative acetyltransferase
VARFERTILPVSIEAGLDACRAGGEHIVLVLGHPGYYTRFGFSTKLTARLRSAYSGPAFHALELIPGALELVEGAVGYPAAFDSV